MASRRKNRGTGCLGAVGCLALLALVAAAIFIVLSRLIPSSSLGGMLSGTRWDSVPAIDVEDIDEDGLAFASLGDDQKVMYKQLLDGVSSLEATFEVYGDPHDLDDSYHAVLVDHPELFWVDGSTHYSYYEDGGPITVTPGLALDLGEVEDVQAKVEAAADEFLASIPAEADDYSKAKFAYEYVINTTDYDAGAAQNQNITSVFLGHASVCAGYARTYQYLLLRAGVPCSFVEGSIASTGEDHAWNIVLVDGEYTYVDPTWGDPTYPGLDEGQVGVVYDYLGLTTEEVVADDHRFDDESMWPVCDSSAANYYVHEGLSFDGADDLELSEAFWRQVGAGVNPVAFRFSSDESYAQARDELAEGGFLADDIRSLFGEQDRLGTSYQYQYSDALHILKLFL